MPETTPIYAFPYPCSGETVNDTVFANLANAIDTKLLDVSNDEFLALNRFNQLLTSATNTIAPGADVVITGTDSSYVFPSTGVWIVNAVAFSLLAPPTINSARISVRNGAVAQFRNSANTNTNITQQIEATGIVVANSLTTLDFTVFYSGTGTWDVAVRWSAKMIVRIA